MSTKLVLVAFALLAVANASDVRVQAWNVNASTGCTGNAEA